MMEYDSKVIQEFAARLYSQEKSIVTFQFFVGILIGLLAAMVVSLVLVHTIDFLIIAIGVLAGGVLGYSSGRNRSFELKLQAQIALCQAKIEENSRK